MIRTSTITAITAGITAIISFLIIRHQDHVRMILFENMMSSTSSDYDQYQNNNNQYGNDDVNDEDYYEKFLSFMRSTNNPSSKRYQNLKVQYMCPTEVGLPKNGKNNYFDWYEVDTQKFISNERKLQQQNNNREGEKEVSLSKSTSIVETKTNNSSSSSTSRFRIEPFLNQAYAGWGITPKQRQTLLQEGWIHWYGENLKSGDTIFESACGTGFTLYVILELLREKYDITNLEVHGNDYMKNVLPIVNELYYQQDVLENHITKGQFCQGDSTNLDYIPDSSFDLVFTGYINPIEDPLDVGLNMGFFYCVLGLRSDLMIKEQQMQEDWFSAWVVELIRIAKPGGTIIIEGMTVERCPDALFQWGGVSRNWWTSSETHQKYQWNIDPTIGVEIIEFNPENKYSTFLNSLSNFYNIKMVKNK